MANFSHFWLGSILYTQVGDGKTSLSRQSRQSRQPGEPSAVRPPRTYFALRQRKRKIPELFLPFVLIMSGAPSSAHSFSHGENSSVQISVVEEIFSLFLCLAFRSFCRRLWWRLLRTPGNAPRSFGNAFFKLRHLPGHQPGR